MKLSKEHLRLLGEVRAGTVWRRGGERRATSTVETDGKNRDVTVPLEALRREAFVTLARASTGNARTVSRQYVLMPRGAAALGGES